MLAAALIFTTGACSDDDAERSRPSASAASAADQALVDRIVLQAADMPDGWTVSETEADGNGELDLPEGCAALEAALDAGAFDGQTAEAESQTFVRGDLRVDGSEVQLVADVASGVDEDAAAASFAPLRGEDVPQCLADGLEASLAAAGGEVEFDEVRATSLEPPDLGDETLAFQARTALTVQGSSFPVTLDVMLARTGRIAISLAATSIGEPPPSGDLGALLAIMVDRAGA